MLVASFELAFSEQLPGTPAETCLAVNRDLSLGARLPRTSTRLKSGERLSIAAVGSSSRQAVAGAFADDAPDHRKRLEWVLRHLCAYLIWREQPNSILLKHFDRLRQVRVRIGHDVGISRHLHPLCRSIHFVDRVKEAARGDNGNQVDLIGGNEPRVGFPAGKKHAFSGCHLEDFTVGIHLHLTRKNVKKNSSSRVWTWGGGSVPRKPCIGREKTRDRKSTRLNSSHANISYAAFCL